MIYSFYTDGFRSLERFSLKISSELTVLVGPNGSGKTNIIDAISFAGDAIGSNLTDAVRNHGGVGSIFRKSRDGKYVKKVSFGVQGIIVIPSSRGKSPKPATICYEYKFQVKLDASGRVKLSGQQLALYNVTDKMGEPHPDVTLGIESADLLIAQRRDKLEVLRFDSSRVGPTTFLPELPPAKAIAQLHDHLNTRNWGDRSLLSMTAPFIYAAHNIRSSAGKMRVLAFNPARIREGDDIGEPAAVQSDGRGLAATMYALQARSMPGMPPQVCEAVAERIVSRLSLAVASITSVKAFLDTSSGKIRLAFDYLDREGLGNTIYAASEGTLKWLAFLAAIETQDFFAIEEPENYMHPWMQQELVRMLRERSVDKHAPVIISTHSETMLNAIDPTEVRVVSLEKGRTRIREIKRQARLREAIASTGFGLGFYYLSGELSEQ